MIADYDSEDAFVYADPPYIDADQAHYAGYTEDDFTNLLKQLARMKGKFLLSSYPSAVLDQHIKENGWLQRSKTSRVLVRADINKIKTECLTANYKIDYQKKLIP